MRFQRVLLLMLLMPPFLLASGSKAVSAPSLIAQDSARAGDPVDRQGVAVVPASPEEEASSLEKSCAGLQAVREAVEHRYGAKFDTASDSDYQTWSRRSQLSARSLLERCELFDALVTAAELITNIDSSAALELAMKAEGLVKTNPQPTVDLAIAEALRSLAWTRSWNNEQSAEETLLQAEFYAKRASQAKKDALTLLQYGRLLSQSARVETQRRGYELLRQANISPGISERTVQHDVLQDLLRAAVNLGLGQDARQWYSQLEAKRLLTEMDAPAIAEYFESESRYKDAGVAWKAAAMSTPVPQYWCFAGRNFYAANEVDESLATNRECLRTGIKGTERSVVLQRLASDLLQRGVYEEAARFSREATTEDPDSAFAFYGLARSLEYLGKFSESVTAAEQAVRLSDGRHSFMHFQVGSAYFELGNWKRAQLAYEKAAELDKDDSSSTYNVALCLRRQGYFHDAARWLKETLKRKPDHLRRDEILKDVEQLMSKP